MTRLAYVFRGRLARFFAVFFAIYALFAILTEAPTLILVMNDLVMSAAAGVCITYAPVLPIALTSVHPTKGDYLGAGVFLVSACMLILRVTSVIARDLGYPEIYNSDAVTFALLLGLMGGLLHLWAPNVEDGRVPAARWTSTGIVVAIGLFIAIGAWSAHVGLKTHASIELR